MPLTDKNLETLVNMLSGLAQRQDTIRQLANQLHAGVIWRSLDGQLAIALSDAQRAQLEDFITTYLNESEVLIASARAMLSAPSERWVRPS